MNASDRLADLMVTRQLILQRVIAGEAAALNRQLEDIANELERLLQGPPLTEMGVRRLNRAISELMERVGLEPPKLSELAELEGDFVLDAFGELSLNAVLPSKEVLERIATSSLIQGETISGWFGRLDANTRFELARAVRAGVALGETNGQMARRILSNGERGGEVLAKTRRDALAIVRTSVQTVANEVRQATYQENSDLVKGVQWLSTLDSRTSDICAARSGLVWTLPDYKPEGHAVPWLTGPPAHWNCRSTTIPVLRTLEELGIAGVDELPPATRSSMDGQVAADLSFDQFLRRKPPEFADEMLGKGRAELWRAGTITLNQLLDQRGNPLSLKELRELYGKPKRKPRARPAPRPAPAEPPPPAAPTPTPSASPVVPPVGATAANGVESARQAIQRMEAYELPLAVRQAKQELDVLAERRMDAVRRYNAMTSANSTITERLDAFDAYKELDKSFSAANASYAKLLKPELAKQLDAIAVPENLRGNAEDIIRGPVSSTVAKKTAEAQGLLHRLIAGDILPSVRVTLTRKKRAFYHNGLNSIFVNSRMSVSTYVHEIVHNIEYRHPEVSARTKAFLLKRAEGGPLERLRDITGVDYGPLEVAYRDRWEELGGDAYMGKWYNRPSTEVLTMGMKRLIANPRLLFEEDRELFEFLIETFHKAF